MDPFHEQKAIARQNREWAAKKTKRKNNLEKDHPWLSTDGAVKRKREELWNKIILPENNVDNH